MAGGEPEAGAPRMAGRRGTTIGLLRGTTIGLLLAAAWAAPAFATWSIVAVDPETREVGYAAAVSFILLLIILTFSVLNFRLAGGDNTT